MRKTQALKIAVNDVLVPVIVFGLLGVTFLGAIIVLGTIFGPMLAYIVFLAVLLVCIFVYTFYDSYKTALMYPSPENENKGDET